MLLKRHVSDLPFSELERGSVVTIGAYDGLHLGHRELLDRVLEEAAARKLPSVVMSFEPTPKEFFSRGEPPARLMRLREKAFAFKSLGIDLFFCLRFGEAMRDISAADFIRRYLVHGLNVQHLVIGDDFRFARNREGDVETLERAGHALDYSVEHVGSVVVDDERVSSTAVRNALKDGDDDRAARYLGRPYRMSGRVIKGEQLGRTLGYPTANVDVRRTKSPVLGIYAVRVSGVSDEPIDGVASVGTRPTFGAGKTLLEAHLFDFDGDLYGKLIHVDFIARLRTEEHFDSADALVEQMHVDAAQAREILGRKTS